MQDHLCSAPNEVPNLGLGPNWDQNYKKVLKSPNFAPKSQILSLQQDAKPVTKKKTIKRTSKKAIKNIEEGEGS